MSALAAAEETSRGTPSVIVAVCVAHASASSLPAIPWWLGIQSRVDLPTHLLSMRLWSAVLAEPLWVLLRSDWLSVQMAAVACDGKNHSSVMRMAAFSSSYDEVIAAPLGLMRVHGILTFSQQYFSHLYNYL